MFRSEPARWLEVLVAHDDCAPALAALSQSGAIELEPRAAPVMFAPLMELKPLLDRYVELERRFGMYWPAPRPGAATAAALRDVLLRALGRISMWYAIAAPMVQKLQSLENDIRLLGIWRSLLESDRNSGLDFGLLVNPDEVIGRRLYRFPDDVTPPSPSPAIVVRFEIGDENVLLLIASRATLDEFHRLATAHKGRELPLPRWLHDRAADNFEMLDRRLRRARRNVERLRNVLCRLGDSCGLAPAIGDIERLRWFAGRVERLPASENFAWIHGWSGVPESILRAALAASGARALLRFSAAPEGVTPPRLFRNPVWARPFELFARALGIPARDEFDPSVLLVLIAPLMFGYMFGDVGQGAVLLAMGIGLGRRYPFARLLVAGGASAMVFGFLFGSVFAREDWIAAAWLHPLAHPFTVLTLPLAAGVALLALGLVLNGVEAHWRGEGRQWFATEAGILLAYVSAMPMFLDPRFGWLVATGLTWSLLGSARHTKRLRALAAGGAHVIEQTLQLAVNTLSFARIGAFALAHAGLSSAVALLAHAAAHPVTAFAIMLFGNVAIIAIEALVVSVQTVRLVLFEFFVRFLRGTGRAFNPLPPPFPSLTVTRSPA